MMDFAVNLSFHYQDLAFLDRFAAARKDGFNGVEFLFPYEHDAREIAGRLENNELQQALFNMPPGDWAAGDRGIAAELDKVSEFRSSVDTALDYADALGCTRLHCMAGLVIDQSERERMREVYLKNLDYAASQAAGHGITILIEPLNGYDVPDYLVRSSGDAVALVEELSLPNVKLQFDIYHVQIIEGDVTRRIKEHADKIGHVQVASVPDRNEPGDGELDVLHCLRVLRMEGYDGWVGCEYHPKSSTKAGLGWIEQAKLDLGERK